ncbi:MAG TPA: hypothetical protein PK733_13700 [Clostridiales bacterium]|nr:hypothetical protein [Clostridiales bacterium]
MRRNMVVLGNRSIQGSFGRILSAGEIIIKDSTIKSLYCAGDTDIKNSSAEKVRCAGDIDASSTNFISFKAAGDVNLKGICKAETAVITGSLNAELFQCNVLRNSSRNSKINGVLEWSGGLQAETFESLYSFTLNCDYEFKNIISSAILNCNNEIVCENFYSFGGLSAQALNAENIFILINDDISLECIVGSNIRISNTFNPDKKFKNIPKSASYGKLAGSGNIIIVNVIEGDNIIIENTKSELVSGMDVFIGDLCIIEKVEYRNSVRISEKAVVNEVVKI